MLKWLWANKTSQDNSENDAVAKTTTKNKKQKKQPNRKTSALMLILFRANQGFM